MMRVVSDETKNNSREQKRFNCFENSHFSTNVFYCRVCARDFGSSENHSTNTNSVNPVDMKWKKEKNVLKSVVWKHWTVTQIIPFRISLVFCAFLFISWISHRHTHKMICILSYTNILSYTLPSLYPVNLLFSVFLFFFFLEKVRTCMSWACMCVCVCVCTCKRDLWFLHIF